jgi:subtilisin family serine protease
VASAIDRRTVVCASPDQVSCELDGEAAVLSLATGTYFGLDDTAAVVWAAIQAPAAVAAVVAAVVAAYDVPAEQAEADVIAFLGELREQGLLEVRAAP